jgi:hypothetical protein
MRRSFYLRWRLLVILSLPFCFSSCFRHDCIDHVAVKVYTPVFLDEIHWQVNPEFLSEKKIKNIGKVNAIGQYFFINEMLEGIHVIDNSNPTAPIPLGFISIPGNIDFDTDGRFLYADSYADLLTIDISNIRNPRLIQRKRNAFQHSLLEHNSRIIGHYVAKDSFVDFQCGVFTRNYMEDDGTYIAELGLNKGINDRRTGFRFFSGMSIGNGGPSSRILRSENNFYTINGKDLGVGQIANNGTVDIHSLYTFDDLLEGFTHIGDFLGVIAQSHSYFTKRNNSSSLNFTQPFFLLRWRSHFHGSNDSLWLSVQNGHFGEVGLFRLNEESVPLKMGTLFVDKPLEILKLGSFFIVCQGKEGFSVFELSNFNFGSSRLLLKHSGIHAKKIIRVDEHSFLIVSDSGLTQFELTLDNTVRHLSHIPFSNQ